MPIQQGRPRLDSIKGFKQTFARLLPGLNKGAISKGEMARTLSISHRSLNRYLSEFEVRISRPHRRKATTIMASKTSSVA